MRENVHVLLVEDSDDDTSLFGHALRVSRLRSRFTRVCNAVEAIDYLKAKPPFDDRDTYPFPEMILTDLNMPGGDGFDLLSWLKAHDECAVIPTIVLSSSYLEADVAKAYQLGANAFLSKPSNFHDLAHLLLTTHTFWSLCQRPPVPRNMKCA